MFLMKILLDFEVIEIENFFYKKYSDDEKILYRKLVKDFIFMCEQFKKEGMDYVKISEIMFAYKNHPNIVDPNIKSDYNKLLKCTKEYNSKVLKEAEKVKKGKSKNQNVSVELVKKREEEEKTRLQREIDKEISTSLLKICQQFTQSKDLIGGKGFMNLKVDIKLVLSILGQKMKYSGDMELIDNIMNFQLDVLERSRIAATFDQEADLKEEMKFMQTELQEVKENSLKILEKLGG